MIHLRNTLLGFAVAALAMILPVQAGEKSDSKVKVSAKASKIVDGKQSVTITIDIDKGWYIYANPVGAADFEDNHTRVTFKADGKDLKADVVYPAGAAKQQGKQTLKIYEKTAIVTATLVRKAGDSSPLRVAIEVNACSKTECLLTGVVKLTIP